MSPLAQTLVPFAHTGHWYHSLLYALPIVLIALALWWSGRRDPAAREPGHNPGEGPDEEPSGS